MCIVAYFTGYITALNIFSSAKWGNGQSKYVCVYKVVCKQSIHFPVFNVPQFVSYGRNKLDVKTVWYYDRQLVLLYL